MREALGPYRAALTLGRRRSLILLLVVALSLFGALAWGSYRDLNGQRRFLHQLQTGTFTQESLFRFGVACQGGEFNVPPPGELGPSGESAGPPGTEGKPTGPPSAPTCQFVGPDGTPIGPTFEGDPFGGPGGPKLDPQFIDQIRPELITSQKMLVREMEKLLGPRFILSSRIHGLGTFVGMVFVVLFAATFIGADFRWGVWRTLLSHEPRRAKVLASKLAAMWTFVIVGFLVALAVTTGVDVAMRSVLHVHANGGPSTIHLAKESGWAALSLELYATIAATLALAVRTSIAGIASLLLTVGDHLIVGKYHWLRHFSPVQQVAALLPTPERIATAYVWFPRVTGGFVCDRTSTPDGFPNCREILFKPIPHWRASVVLATWTVGFALLAWAVLRARDVPQ